MSGNFVSYQDANVLMTKIAQKISGGGGGDGWSPHCIIHSDTGSTVTAVKGSKTVNAVETSEGIFELDLPGNNDYGDWTFNGELDGTPMNVTIDIKFVQRYDINFINGKTVLPVNDLALLLECAGIYDSEIETISDLLDDEASLLKVISSNNAIDYLVRCSSFINDFASNQTAMSYIGINDYAADILSDNQAWCAAMVASAYIESVFESMVPTMTSNTTPKGRCISNGTYAGSPFNAFDNTDQTYVSCNVGTGYLGYIFEEPVCVKGVFVYGPLSDSYTFTDGRLQAQDNGGSWNTVSNTSLKRSNTVIYSTYENTKNHTGYRISQYKSGNDYVSASRIKFYGRKKVYNVN